MRRRATFIHDGASEFNPESVQVTKDRFFLPEIKAAREEQLKYSLDELPEELQHVLINAHELHLRWAPEHLYNTVAPYLSRLSPGLHVFYTPLEGGSDDLLCPLLRKAFDNDLKCRSPSHTFIKSANTPTEFSTTPALQYHSVLPDLDHLAAYLQRTVCPHSSLLCIHSTTLLSTADALDLSWDAISNTLTLTAFWSRPPSFLVDPEANTKTNDAWSLSIDTPPTNSRVEVGILSSEPPSDDPHELTLSGFLTVLGKDTSPKPTRFSFPSRHHSIPASQPQTYTATITEPQGLHPTLRISFPNATALTPPSTAPPDAQCALQIHLTLPSPIFVDPYALKPSDPNFVASHHITAVHALAGYTDLEAPAYLPSPWGSTLLLTPSLPSTDNLHQPAEATWDVTIPLHLRYLPPSPQSHLPTTLPWPTIYWACTADSGTKFPINPFDRIHLGYDGAYGPRTMFYHLTPSNNSTRLTETLQVPVYDTSRLSPYTVEVVTLLCIVAGFAWVLVKLWPALWKELQAYVPETVLTDKPMTKEWEEPVKGGPPPPAGVRRRVGG
ncbi:uncharacterized protein HMPREF1541_04472 [Cyphellophora europaea CBS 101466]|uniref:Protein PBN1 n=1 Tax=Cyphellophora europaea (strain CBS 101466) TaxID=1220924 RepID=W2RUJ2_CYPE1|nr:uncharacterized protein HMPREF1541_04472 [Cyphellophora europaea CBS 101466]ETN40196.1 hypothetical protein HMPREF1541_04472 [Cyphellophora europaea CBS 101466]